MIELAIATPHDMERLGARLATVLSAGDIVALDGPLGAGKTTLTRGLGAALEVRGTVTSPTFVLARTHPRPAGAPLVHVDAYRLRDPLELDDLDLDLEHSIVVMEWAEGMLSAIAEEWLAVRIERPRTATSDDEVGARRVRIRGHGERWSDLSALERALAGDSATRR